MTEFLRGDETIEKICREATDAEDMRRQIKDHLARTGVIAQERGSGYGANVVGRFETDGTAAPEPAAAAKPYKYEKEIRFAESTGRRTLVIRANSLEDLTRLENEVTGAV